MSCSRSPGPHRTAGDVVIHCYTFMARTPRAVSLIIDWIKMSCELQCMTRNHFLKKDLTVKRVRQLKKKMEWVRRGGCVSKSTRNTPKHTETHACSLMDNMTQCPHCLLSISAIDDSELTRKRLDDHNTSAEKWHEKVVGNLIHPAMTPQWLRRGRRSLGMLTYN